MSVVARWNGTDWVDVGGGFAGYATKLLAHDGHLWIAGGMTSYAGGKPSNVMRWDGTHWSAPSAQSLAIEVNYLASFGGELYAMGKLNQVGHVVRWDGNSWLPIGAGLFPSTGFAVEGSVFQNALYIGGNFWRANGVPATNLARIEGEGTAPSISKQPVSTQVVLGGATFLEAVAEGAKAYQWHLDGQPLLDGTTPLGTIFIGATEPMLLVTNAQLDAAGKYQLKTLNACGETWSDEAELTVLGACVADLDGDGKTCQSDLGLLLTSFGTCVGQPGFNSAANIATGGSSAQCIDQADLGLLLGDYGCGGCP